MLLSDICFILKQNLYSKREESTLTGQLLRRDGRAQSQLVIEDCGLTNSF